jgi:hypothetical protein
MTYQQLLTQAKFHRKTADQLEALAKKQQKLQTQIDRLNSTGRRTAGPRTKLPSTPRVVAFVPRKGKVAERLLDLLSTGKAYSLDDLWTLLEPEKVTPNYLAMCRSLYTLGKQGLVESTAKGVWRKTVKPSKDELHAKAQ